MDTVFINTFINSFSVHKYRPTTDLLRHKRHWGMHQYICECSVWGNRKWCRNLKNCGFVSHMGEARSKWGGGGVKTSGITKFAIISTCLKVQDFSHIYYPHYNPQVACKIVKNDWSVAFKNNYPVCCIEGKFSFFPALQYKIFYFHTSSCPDICKSPICSVIYILPLSITLQSWGLWYDCYYLSIVKVLHCFLSILFPWAVRKVNNQDTCFKTT